MTPLHARSLVAVVEGVARGDFTCAEHAEALLAQVAATEAAIGAWACLDADHVRRDAARCDAAAPARTPLRGAPVGVKDIVDTLALPTRMGSPAFDAYLPTADAACIERLLAAGGYVFGKTVTTELAYMHPGRTRNPWNLRHTPGGSSQGSAAAVAAGHVPAALGTQTNGSVIRPASYCGVVGFKPTLHAISFRGVNVFSETFDTLGTFTRSVADAALLAAALADAGRIAPVPLPPQAPPRLAWLPGLPWTDVDEGTRTVLDAAAGRLQDAGAQVVAIALPEVLDQAAAVHRAIMLAEGARNLAALRARADAQLSATLREALDEGGRIAPGGYAQALASRSAMIAAATDWLGRFDALLLPAAPATAPEGLARTGDPSCCTLASLLGAPALTLPVGRDAQGLPVGLQLVGPPGADDALLAVAAWCEARLPFAGLV